MNYFVSFIVFSTLSWVNTNTARYSIECNNRSVLNRHLRFRRSGFKYNDVVQRACNLSRGLGSGRSSSATSRDSLALNLLCGSAGVMLREKVRGLRQAFGRWRYCIVELSS